MLFTTEGMDSNEDFEAPLMPEAPGNAPGYLGLPDFGNPYPNWVPNLSPDCSYNAVDLSGEGVYPGEYDVYSLQLPMPPQSGYLTPATLDVDWGGRNGSVSTANTSSGSPFAKSSLLGTELDAPRVPDLLPSSEPIKRRSDSSERPPKRNRSHTVDDDNVTGPATRSKDDKGRVTLNAAKPRPNEKPASGKEPGERRRSAPMSATASRSATTHHKTPQLRTASRKPKAGGKGAGSSPPEDKDNEEDDLLTPDERRARQSHNLVEKQYRSRLNQQFESLLAVLPPVYSGNRSFSVSSSSSGAGGSKSRHPRDAAATAAGVGSAVEPAADDRRLSKAEVLDMARQRIVALERENVRLKSERMELAANVGVVRDAVAKGGIAGAAVAA